MNQVEIALHYTILTRLTMNRNIRIIKILALSILDKREIILVNFGSITIIKGYMPVGALDIDYIYVIALFIKERVQTLT